MTLEELATAANLSANYIGTVENGRRDPSLTTLTQLARALNIQVSELFGPEPERSSTASTMAALLESAPPVMQKGVLQFLSAVARRPRT